MQFPFTETVHLSLVKPKIITDCDLDSLPCNCTKNWIREGTTHSTANSAPTPPATMSVIVPPPAATLRAPAAAPCAAAYQSACLVAERTSSMNDVPSIGLWQYGAISWNPSDAYKAFAFAIDGSVSNRMRE